MSEMNIVEAINSALQVVMAQNSNVVILGEDVGKFGGVFRATKGLHEAFGSERVIDTPLSESGIVGVAIGMAAYGLRPVVEIQFADFIFPAFDQIVSELAKLRFRSGGQYSAPLVIRTPFGGGVKGGLYHSQSPEAHFAHTPGLKVVVPSNPTDAKGLLISAIYDEDPVIFFEPKRVYRAFREEVEDQEFRVPLGQARTVLPGNDITIVAWGAMLHEANKASIEAQQLGISCELIDPRSLVPFDIATVSESVQKTGRLIIVHEAPRTGGFAGEVIAQITENCFYHLKSPPSRVTGADTPFPYVNELEYLPLAPRILEQIQVVYKAS